MKCAVHPGIQVQGALYVTGLSQAEFARQAGVTRQEVSALILEKRGISPRMAVALGKVLGPSARHWMELQASFDLAHYQERVEERVHG